MRQASRQQHGDDGRGRAEGARDDGYHDRADRCGQSPPHAARDDDRDRKNGQSCTVAAVRRIKVTGPGTRCPEAAADEMGEEHPGAAQQPSNGGQQAASESRGAARTASGWTTRRRPGTAGRSAPARARPGSRS
jgi:hypothetical protein